MPAYHSQFTSWPRSLANMAVMPLKTKVRGPAPHCDTEIDIVDEAINYFRPNILFKSYEITNDSDRTMIYLTLYISECLRKMNSCRSKAQALTDMYALAVTSFALPGDAHFPLNAMYGAPQSGREAEELRQYMSQLRQETGARLCELVFADGAGPDDSKWWLCFARYRFMNFSLSQH